MKSIFVTFTFLLYTVDIMKQKEITIDDVLKAFKNPPTHDGEKLVRRAFEFA
jgi:hypothetical protein